MSGTTLRLAGPEDAATLAAIIEAMDHHYGDPPHAAGAVEAAARSWLRGEGSDARFLLAFAGDAPIGLACFALLHPGTGLGGVAFLKDLFVVAEWRGRRVGEDLVKALAAFCRDEGIRRVDWVVENDRAEAFYARLGADPRPEKRSMRFEAETLAALAGS